MCIFSKLYFAEVVDLVSLTCLDAGHEMCDNYVAFYTDQ